VVNFRIKHPQNNIIQQMYHTFFRNTTAQNHIIKKMWFSSCPEDQSPQIKLILYIYLTIYYALVKEKQSDF